MILVIDGYNLLKQIFPGVKGPIDKHRDQFIRQLGYYQQKKRKEIKEVIVVFDAGPFGHATREITHGVVVVFSGQKSNADNWIIDFAERKKNEEILVITMDRKLIEACCRFGASALSSIEFYHIMQRCILEDLHNQPTQLLSGDFEKYEPFYLEEELTTHQVDRQALDLLMEQESLNVGSSNFKEEERQSQERKGSRATLSKEEKKAYAKFKKLR